MKKIMFINLFVIVAVFAGLWYWFGSDDKIENREEPQQVLSENTQSDSKEEAKVEISSTEIVLPKTSPAKIVEKDNEQMIGLKKAFSQKYSKSTESVSVIVDSTSGNYVKGSVDFDQSGYPATFYAASSNGVYIIAAVENGVVPCSAIQNFAFPSSMIPQCYSVTQGSVVAR